MIIVHIIVLSELIQEIKHAATFGPVNQIYQRVITSTLIE